MAISRAPDAVSFLYREADVGPVVEADVAAHEALGGGIEVDAEGIVAQEVGKGSLALCQRGMEEGVAVGGKDNLVGSSAVDHLHVVEAHGEAVEHGVVDVLLAAGVDDVREDEVAPLVVLLEVGHGASLTEGVADVFGPSARIAGFLRLGIAIEDTVDQALAVADHPYLLALAAVDDAAGGGALLRVVAQQVEVEMGGEVGVTDALRDTVAKGEAGGGSGHAGDVVADDEHAAAAVGHVGTDADGGLAGAAVDDGHEVRTGEEAVFVGGRACLPDGGLFDDGHGRWMACRRARTVGRTWVSRRVAR